MLPDPPPLRAATASVEQTRALGAALARVLQAGDVVVLTGDLGAGKTALTQGIGVGLGLDAAEVTSPTFALVAEHQGSALRLLHADVYRLDGPDDAEDLALAEQVEDPDTVAVVEWGERVLPVLPDDRLDVVIEPGEGLEDRVFALHLRGPSWEARRGRVLAALA